MRTRITCIAAAFLIASFCTAQSFLPIADSIRKARGVPAIGYAVVSDNRVIDIGVTGYRKYRTRDSAQTSDRFQLGTNSFAFVSFIAGKLVESGKIKWTTTFTSLFLECSKSIQPHFA